MEATTETFSTVKPFQSAAQASVAQTPEDPLAYLPCSTIVEFSKGQTIYGPDWPSACLYLVIDGTVKVSRKGDSSAMVVVDVYRPDEFFGESAFVAPELRVEEAVALETSRVMTWAATDVTQLMARKPGLGIAILQMLVRRLLDFSTRIQSFSLDPIGPRLARSLLRFSARMGRDGADGFAEMMPFTHELLSQYVGTSREIITHYMNLFRRKNLLRYSRKGISVNRTALREWLLSETSKTGPSADAAAG